MASLKERMKQLQALKESVQAKSEVAEARERELSEIAQQGPVKPGSVGKLRLESGQDDTTTGGETQTTAEETTASPTMPPEPPIKEEEEASTPEPPPAAMPPADEETEPVDNDEVDEVVIIEETEEVEGDSEGVEIQEEEEIVEVFEDGEDESEYEEVEETAHEEEVTEYEESETPEIADEQPILASKSMPLEETAEDAPMDELAYLQRTKAQMASLSPATITSFDEGSEELLPIFQLLDESEEEGPRIASTAISSKAVSRSTPKTGTAQSVMSRSTAPSDVESGTRERKDRTGGLPPDFDDPQRRKWQCIICFLVIIGACAVVALVLPFVLDYKDEKTASPTISPAPTMEPSASPTRPPTISPAPTDPPTNRPSASPTVSKPPTDSPTGSPTKNPTPSPTAAPTTPATQSPTGSPTPAPSPLPTGSPVVPTNVPTAAPVATSAPTGSPLAETNAPVQPTASPVNPTAAPVAPTRAPVTPTRAPASSPSGAPTTLRLGNLIDVFLIPISGEEVFQDQNSPQFKAAQFIAEEDDYEYTGDLPAETILAERYAMATFYYATNGDDWNQCFEGDTTCFGPWLEGDVCSWEYIACNQAGRVVSISFGGEYVDVQNVGLTGFIAPEIFLLEDLEELVIVDEAVGGTLPARFGTDAPNVRQVIIQGTEIGGTIPDGYLANSPLESFILNSNNLAGSIPLNVGIPGTLTEMDLSSNQLTGALPGGLLIYSSLSSLALDSNLLQGSIPSGVYSMTSLQRLYLNNNLLMSGSISTAIGQLQSLIALRLGTTGIGGTLPGELFTLAAIEELDFRDASFRGTLPAAFSDLGDTLKLLHLQENSFTGSVPASFGDLSQLAILNLEGNNLRGSIPATICALRRQDLDELTVDCDEVACSCCTECFR